MTCIYRYLPDGKGLATRKKTFAALRQHSIICHTEKE